LSLVAGSSPRPSRRQELVVHRDTTTIDDRLIAPAASGAAAMVLALPTPAYAADAVAADLGWRMRPSRRSVVGAVVRRLFPYLIEATVVPTVIFYSLLAVTTELRWAIVGALAWSLAAVARRCIAGRPIPGLLILATLGISVLTVIYLWSSNSFVYFVQPILRTVLTAGLFAGSVAIGRPLIARFAADFCPLSPDVQRRPAVLRLFRRLTFLWAGVNGLVAAASLVLLLTVPVSVFVVTATVSAWVVTCTGVVLTVADSVTTARREGLVTALAPNGTLYAATSHPGLG
jgi:hypothetical protein